MSPPQQYSQLNMSLEGAAAPILKAKDFPHNTEKLVSHGDNKPFFFQSNSADIFINGGSNTLSIAYGNAETIIMRGNANHLWIMRGSNTGLVGLVGNKNNILIKGNRGTVKLTGNENVITIQNDNAGAVGIRGDDNLVQLQGGNSGSLDIQGVGNVFTEGNEDTGLHEGTAPDADSQVHDENQNNDQEGGTESSSLVVEVDGPPGRQVYPFEWRYHEYRSL